MIGSIIGQRGLTELGLRLRTLVVCTLLVASVALPAVAPAAAAISDGDWETDGDGWDDNDSDWRTNDSESVRNLTETATGVVSNTTGVVSNTTGTVENVTNATAGATADSTAGAPEVAGVGVEDSNPTTLDGGPVGLTGGTAPALAGAPEIQVTSDNVAVEVGSTTNAAPGLTVDVPLDGSTTASSGPSVTPPADSEADTGSDAVPDDSGSAASGGDDAEQPTGQTVAVEATTAGVTADEESTESASEADTNPTSVLGSLAWFDGAELFGYVPALGTAMFVAVAQPWAGFLSMSTAIAADWLGRFAALLRFGRHDGSDPLEHETRERIHDRITDTPGVSLSALADDLDTPLSTVRHHLRVLERERLVSSRKLRGNRRLFPIGTDNEELAAALEKDSSAAIIGALRKYGAATVGDIVDEVETSYSTVSYHLSRLADDGLVVQEKDGASKVTRLAPSVRSTLETADDGPATGGSREVSAD